MELLEALATTRSIRRYRPDPVPDADLATMLWAASRAPSGSNRQPFRFLVLRDGPRAQAAKALLGEAARAAWAAKRSNDGYDRGLGGADPPRPRPAWPARWTTTSTTSRTRRWSCCRCLVRYRAPHPTEGASVYPAVQNLLLAARATWATAAPSRCGT